MAIKLALTLLVLFVLAGATLGATLGSLWEDILNVAHARSHRAKDSPPA